jgi:hypothetical protein
MNIDWPLGATATHQTLDGFAPSTGGGPFCSAEYANPLRPARAR